MAKKDKSNFTNGSKMGKNGVLREKGGVRGKERGLKGVKGERGQIQLDKKRKR